MAAEFVEAVNSKTLEYVNISKFQNLPGIGLDCDCCCPKCGETVGARIFDNQESSCFFHKSNSACGGGGTETKIHLFAKKLLEEKTKIVLPDPTQESKKVTFSYASVRLERKIGVLRPDIVLVSSDNNQLIVEITATHKTFNNTLKMESLKQLAIPAIEITLNKSLISGLALAGSSELQFSTFAKLYTPSIIEKTDSKRWLVTPHDNLVVQTISGEKKNKDNAGFWFWVALLTGLLVFLKSKRKKVRPKRLQNNRSTIIV